MSERLSQNPMTEDLFGGEKLNITGVDPLLDFGESAGKKTGRFIKNNKYPIVKAAALTTAVFTSGSNPQEDIYFSFDPATVTGIVTGTALMVEEAFEKGHEKFPQKMKAILKKAAAGFAGGWSGYHIASNNAEIVDFVLAGGATIAIAEETSIPQLIGRFAQQGLGAVHAVSERREFNQSWQEMEQLIKAAQHWSSTSQSKRLEALRAISTLASKYNLAVCKNIDTNGYPVDINRKAIGELFKHMGQDQQLSEAEAKIIYQNYKQSRAGGQE